MTKLKHYLQDGANRQARAVIQFVDGDIESSWDSEFKSYKANIEVSRWENGREQGYIISLRSSDYKYQMNIVVYEHRNSDDICALRWEQCSMNSINIGNIKEGVFEHKYDSIDHSVGYGEVVQMAEWINGELNKFWTETEQARLNGTEYKSPK